MLEISGLARQLQLLVDEQQIRHVMTDYAAFIDARDFDRLRSVFADDVVVDYHNGRTVVTGADAVVGYIIENTAHLAWQHHNVSPYRIDVTGDTAEGLAYLISHQVIRDDPSHVLMMAAHYRTTFTRAADRWRISHMVHTIKLSNFLPVTAVAPVDVHIPPAVAP
ncbi:nuclear transport factor 2 family protein [Planosporangium sp. 12N6]|uniref:nuclear transport factor 2 family protein n=1 Tax=Planosporangium spinosum TaxID=3402278 RepID=UPI003CE74E48